MDGTRTTIAVIDASGSTAAIAVALGLVIVLLLRALSSNARDMTAMAGAAFFGALRAIRSIVLVVIILLLMTMVVFGGTSHGDVQSPSEPASRIGSVPAGPDLTGSADG